MFDDTPVSELVVRARAGEKAAWDEIVERLAPLVWSLCRSYRLSRADADDVAQSVWLRLIEHLPSLRQPAALPGWLSTTTRNECLRVLRVAGRRERTERSIEDSEIPADGETARVDRAILLEERNRALRAAWAQLPVNCRELLSLLIQDPPLTYAEISESLGKPVGSIGPSRGRCLEKLRRCPVLAAHIGDVAKGAGRGEGHDEQMVEQ